MADTLEQSILRKTAEYIEVTQPRIDAENERRAAFVKRATQAAGVLAHRGIIAPSAVNAFVDKIAANENEVWDVVEKLAAVVSADGLGEGVKAEKVASANMGPWDKLYHYGDPRADTGRSGMVD